MVESRYDRFSDRIRTVIDHGQTERSDADVQFVIVFRCPFDSDEPALITFALMLVVFGRVWE
jgi:hypothetical protein